MKNKRDIKPGQKVWIKSLSTRRGDDLSLKEVKVKKVGNKYIELEVNYYGKFDIETLYEERKNYTPSYKLYLSVEDHEIEQEMYSLTAEIRNIFNAYGKSKLTVEQLREIIKIIKQ